VVLKDTPVTVVAAFDVWRAIEWDTPAGRQRGWVNQQWVGTRGPLPINLITPTPAR
jgi:SH3-like domain-containing protein